jgi:hypothetical protein
MVIRYAFAPKSLPCNHLRIPFALVLPRSDAALSSHGTAWLPAQQNGTANAQPSRFNDIANAQRR